MTRVWGPCTIFGKPGGVLSAAKEIIKERFLMDYYFVTSTDMLFCNLNKYTKTKMSSHVSFVTIGVNKNQRSLCYCLYCGLCGVYVYTRKKGKFGLNKNF